MNTRRIEMIRQRPDLAMLEEIVELCDMASRVEPLRTALSKIDAETGPLVPPAGAMRGGVVERVAELARKGLAAGRPVVTNEDLGG